MLNNSRTSSTPSTGSTAVSRRPPGPQAWPATTAGPVKQEKAEEMTRQLRQVEVECVAPYEEQQWVGIGRERDGVEREGVQYSVALSPPYHRASHIRLQSNTCKGLSATEQNTVSRYKQRKHNNCFPALCLYCALNLSSDVIS